MEPGFALFNLRNQDNFVFQFFPNEDRATDRANWLPQETTIGVKPLFYANREPRTLEFNELYLDNTETGESLTPDIKKLQAMMEESENEGSPPALLAVWGDRRERCVLQDLSSEAVYYSSDGNPLRVRFSIVLMQLQPENEGTSVRTGT